MATDTFLIVFASMFTAFAQNISRSSYVFAHQDSDVKDTSGRQCGFRKIESPVFTSREQ